MRRLSVRYPATPSSRFNWNCYLGQHLKVSRKLITPRGLVRTEIDKGIGGFPPGAPPPPSTSQGSPTTRMARVSRKSARSSRTNDCSDPQKGFSLRSCGMSGMFPLVAAEGPARETVHAKIKTPPANFMTGPSTNSFRTTCASHRRSSRRRDG